MNSESVNGPSRETELMREYSRLTKGAGMLEERFEVLARKLEIFMTPDKPRETERAVRADSNSQFAKEFATVNDRLHNLADRIENLVLRLEL